MIDLEQESLVQRAAAWDMVTELLDNLSPDWTDLDGSGKKAAIKAISKIASDLDELRTVLVRAWGQEPIGKVSKSAECGGVDFYFDKIPDGETMLYAHPLPAQAIPEGSVVVSKDDLKRIHRDLDACQKVIWLAGGFDPAYCKDAQESLKLIDSALSAPPKP